MSIKLQSEVWEECTELSGAKLLLLLALADFADDNNQCFPKIKTLAARIRTDERGTRKHMKELRTLGYVKVIDQSNGKRSNTYEIVTNPCQKNPVKKTMVKKTGQKDHGSFDRSNPVISTTPANIYNEPSIEPPVNPHIIPPSQGDVSTDFFPESESTRQTLKPAKRKRATQIPEKGTFDMQYAKDYQMDPDLAFEIFDDWARAKGQTYRDWNLAWKKACRDWLPDQCTRAIANRSTNGTREPTKEEEDKYEALANYYQGQGR